MAESYVKAGPVALTKLNIPSDWSGVGLSPFY